MNHTARRALRATVSLTGLAALGVTLTGTAYAATPAPQHGLADQARQQDASTAMPGMARDSAASSHATSSHATSSHATGGLGQQGLHSFELPGANGTSMPAANPLRTEENSSDPDDVYPSCSPDYDKHDYSALGYNGDKQDDEGYDSDDEDSDCTGFHGKSEDNGYNGYTGKENDRQDENHYRFAPL
jgi:hypothetical protein